MRIRSYPFIRFYALFPRAIRLAANVLILALWLWLYRPVLDYFCTIFTGDDFRTNQVLLVAVLLLIGHQVRRGRWRLRLNVAPCPHLPALALALGGSVLYLLAERFLDVNTLSAILFGLAGYGLLGLWLTPDSIPAWRKGLPVVLLLIGTLPLGDHMQTFVGYPLRLLTARLVGEGLAATGVPSVGVDTILVLENGVSKVDLPCSGVKSLWSGALFLLAVTWIEGRTLNRRWLLTALLFGGLLFVVNLLRVVVLVVVGQVLGWRLMAEMLHVPLGVLGFAAACAGAVGLLHRLDGRGENPPSAPPVVRQGGASWKFTLLLAGGLAVLIAGYRPHPEVGLAQAPPTWEFPPELLTEPQSLKPDEVEWLTHDGAESAERLRFEWRGLCGSLILITSRTWRAHHRPERCFEVYGLSLDDSRPILITPGFPVRFVALGQNGQTLLSATYWFQSAEQTTDDYGTRIWDDLSPPRNRWVLVSILFDTRIDPASDDVRAFYLALHDTVARYLGGVQ